MEDLKHIWTCPIHEGGVCNCNEEEDKGWRYRFTSEFGIHFPDSELQFALAFIEQEISRSSSTAAAHACYEEGQRWGELVRDLKEEAYKKGLEDGLKIIK